MKLTFDEYDELLEKFEKIEGNTFWPSVQDIDLMEKNPDKYIVFCCYLLEKNKKPETNQEKYSKKNLHSFVNKYLELV